MASSERKRKEYRLCIVTWVDILATSGWEKAKDVECPELDAVGWLIHQDRKTIKIASTLDREDTLGESKDEALPIPYGITAFPKGCVRNIKFISESALIL